MLPRNYRLKKEADFRRVYRQGRRMRGCFFDLVYLASNQNTRFGIVVTAKSIKKATKRNRAKRILRSLICQNRDIWPERKDLVIKIKKEISPAESESVALELVPWFKRIND
jgi:ribonuclease P protein component